MFKKSKENFIWVDYVNKNGLKTSGYLSKDDIEIIDVSINFKDDRD